MEKEIVEKIKKLRALAADKGEPHEAVAAYAQAERLMKEHGIKEGNPFIGPFPFPMNRFKKPMFPALPYPECKEMPGKWTQFWDMSSGGGQKLPWHHIYIEAPIDEAKVIFYNRFGRNPDRVTCTCCGSDYSISEESSLAELTAYERGCTTVHVAKIGSELGTEHWVECGERDYRPYMTLTDYIAKHHRPELAESKENPRALARREDYDSKAMLIVRAADVKPEEREGEVPEEGYVWRD